MCEQTRQGKYGDAQATIFHNVPTVILNDVFPFEISTFDHTKSWDIVAMNINQDL
jgi:hypothetical protein